MQQYKIIIQNSVGGQTLRTNRVFRKIYSSCRRVVCTLKKKKIQRELRNHQKFILNMKVFQILNQILQQHYYPWFFEDYSYYRQKIFLRRESEITIHI